MVSVYCFETNGLALPLFLSSVLLKKYFEFFLIQLRLQRVCIICTHVFTPESVIIFSSFALSLSLLKFSVFGVEGEVLK